MEKKTIEVGKVSSKRNNGYKFLNILPCASIDVKWARQFLLVVSVDVSGSGFEIRMIREMPAFPLIFGPRPQ